ncbi:hypothetical protein [Methanolobus bombayensis]|uniref:hypothetical protein n=1 Tax=Methanolobus bombayensis TaxID=38023 RepID=UPI001AEAD2DC|nr:hypothetical protein [Methanolobus bombayensis]MBP1909235.1 hypothetical protein [Methanolobus bombayensis]
MLEAKISVEQANCCIAQVTQGNDLELDILSHMPYSESRDLFLVRERKRTSKTPLYLKQLKEDDATDYFELLQASPDQTLFLISMGITTPVKLFEEAGCFII